MFLHRLIRCKIIFRETYQLCYGELISFKKLIQMRHIFNISTFKKLDLYKKNCILNEAGTFFFIH
jgi:hypothetical protein